MRVAITNFTGGEISSTLSARYDLARYRNALQCMENFLPNPHGGAQRRSGTLFLSELDGPAWLLPFSFSADAGQNFLLLFGQNTLRIANADGLLPLAAMNSPYALEHLPELGHAQVGDVVYLAHRAYPLHKLVRSGEGPHYQWSLAPVRLNTSLPAPGALAVDFSGGGNGYVLRYKITGVDAEGKESLPSAVGEIDGKHPSDWVVGNSANLTWVAVEGAEEYNIYREEAGYFGFVGVSRGTSFIDNNYQADVAETPREDWNPFANGNNPGVVAFHQQRMVLAATADAPQAFYMSRAGDFENFRKSRPLRDDDPVEYHISSGSIDAIIWAASFGDLLLGTSGSEYKASGGDGGPLTVKNISITAQSCWGSACLPPIAIGNSIIHVQRHGARVRDLFYSLEKDGYAGNDLSIMAPHLFDGHALRQWAYQQTPGSNIWIVRDDGALLALTYMKEHDIWGWSRHTTEGSFFSVAAISGSNEDCLLAVVQRKAGGRERWFLERFAPQWSAVDGVTEAFYVDCGSTRRGEPSAVVEGLNRLEGCAVAVLADGSPVEGRVVRQGRIDLPWPASVVHVGLPFTSVLSPMPVEGELRNGASLGRRRANGQCTLRVHASVGGKYGPNRNDLYDFPFVPGRWGEPCELFSGDLEFIPGGGLETLTSLWLAQDRPLPFMLIGLTLSVDMAQN